MVEGDLTLSFEKLVENYYWWLQYIDPDLQHFVLIYIQKFCNYDIPQYLDNNGFNRTLQQLIKFHTLDYHQIYIESLGISQKKLPSYSFTDKIFILESLGISLNYIIKKIINNHVSLKGVIYIFWICFLRFSRLLKRGNLFPKFQGYIIYLFHLNKL